MILGHRGLRRLTLEGTVALVERRRCNEAVMNGLLNPPILVYLQYFKNLDRSRI